MSQMAGAFFYIFEGPERLFFSVGKTVGSVASRVQDITVEIGGDTTKLSTALSKVNKEIWDTQSQDVNKLLKFDPGNAELITQKQKLLAQDVSETMEKLDALKLPGKHANDAHARGEISQKHYDALQREIEETVMNSIQSVGFGVWNNVKSVTSFVLNAVRSGVPNVFNNEVSGIRINCQVKVPTLDHIIKDTLFTLFGVILDPI